MTPRRLVEDIEHFRQRLLVDCFLEMSRGYWLKRADDFAAVGTPDCDEIAQACRNRARVAQLGGDIEEYYALLDDEIGPGAAVWGGLHASDLLEYDAWESGAEGP